MQEAISAAHAPAPTMPTCSGVLLKPMNLNQVFRFNAKAQGHSAAEPQPKQLPLLHPMEERVGERRRVVSLDCPSPRFSPHSFVVERGRKFAQAPKAFMHSSKR